MLNVFHGACFKEQILDVKIYFWFIMDICGIVSSSCACMCFIIRTEIYIPYANYLRTCSFKPAITKLILNNTNLVKLILAKNKVK